MEFALAYPPFPDAWKDLQIAEDCGFTSAWFFDSQLLYSDVYVCMALAAEHTKKMKLGTAVAIPSSRLAPVTAHSIATINQIAPGRVILGIGSGFTGRNTMGLPPLPIATLRSYVESTRRLLAREEVPFHEGEHRGWMRFLHPDHGYINLKDQIPIYMAASGTKVTELVGEIADGWITPTIDPGQLSAGRKALEVGALKAGRAPGEMPIVSMITACVLRGGESPVSPRVLRRVGPSLVLLFHALWERNLGLVGAHEAPLKERLRRYREEYVDKMKTPADRRYLEIHEGHLIYLKPGEERFVDEEMVRNFSCTGSAEEVIARIRAAEAMGVKQVGFQVAGDAREMIEELSREVIAKY